MPKNPHGKNPVFCLSLDDGSDPPRRQATDGRGLSLGLQEINPQPIPMPDDYDYDYDDYATEYVCA